MNLQLATISTPLAAPVITRARLRAANTASAAGAGRLLAQAITTARGAGVTGQVLCRADSAYYGWAFVGTAIRHKAWIAVTARVYPAVVKAISSIEEDSWTPIAYPNAVFDKAEDLGQRCRSHRDRFHRVHRATQGRTRGCHLVVRRVKRLQPLAGDGTEQGELFATYRHHAFITNSTLGLVEADERHRGHAVIEQVIAELQRRAAGTPAQREVRSQRRLGRPRGDRVQHRPCCGRYRPAPYALGDPADPDHQRARPNRLVVPPDREAA